MRSTTLILVLALLPLAAATADGGEAPRVVDGISIIGNNEAPKSLFIVPWKASDVGDELGFTPSLLSDSAVPVDRDVFMRELRFYELSNP